MTTITGTLLLGGGVAPSVAGKTAWMNVEPVAPVFLTDGELLLPPAQQVTIAEDGTWIATVEALPEGAAYKFTAVVSGGAYRHARTVAVPTTGTIAYDDLTEVVPSTAATMYQAPSWVAEVLEAGEAAAEIPALVTAAETAATTAAAALTTIQTTADAYTGSVFGSRRIGFAGDSITAGSGASSTGLAFINQACRIAGRARATPKVNGGVAGERSSQVLTRVPAIIAEGIDHLHIQVGTNDASQSVTVATFGANVAAIADLARKAGLSASIGLVPPRGAAASTTIHQLTRLYNVWITMWAPSAGLTVADTYTPLVDPTTGYLAAASDSGDGTHPSNAGHLLMAPEVAAAIIARHIDPPWPVTSVDPVGLISNPLINGTTGWVTRATTGTATITTTAVAPELGDALPRGNWLTVRINNTGQGTTASRVVAATLDATKYTAGDTLAVFAVVDCTTPGAKLQITNDDVGYSVCLDTAGSVTNPGPILATFTVPVSPGVLRLALSASAAAGGDETARIGAAQVYNLTTGGLIDVIA